MRRNRARTGKERVPDVAIFTSFKRLETPRMEEGFDRLFKVTLHEADMTFDVAPLTAEPGP
jgi:hypothetical protein